MTITHTPPDAEASRASREFVNRRRMGTPVTAVFYLLLLALWELICRLELVAAYILPPPTAIAAAMVDGWALLLHHTWVTFVETTVGFVLGSLIGLLGGIAIAYSPLVERLVYPAVVITQTVPKLALAPLFLVWFGAGLTPKVAITALICLFPVLINTVTGIKGVDTRLRQLMASVSATRLQIFRMVELPTALPHIFGGLQVGITLAVVGALVGEWVGSSEGLGYQILQANSQLRTAETFAGLVMITLMGIVLFMVVRVLERLSLPHQPHESVTGQSM
ncbi:ABC transporter permease [Micromonospora sp. NPDC048830]|uniref:ABC transporter permease n=1 Tax=Micromonospora sp. NPDC048830 TaxID=3364257 RepID=UPI00371AD197